MNPKRKAAQDYIIKYVDKIAQGGQNKELYINLFKSMSDKEFNTFMENLRDDKQTLSVICPNGGKVKIGVENNFKVAKEVGHDFFQYLTITGDRDLPPYKTPNKYLVLKLPVKRAAQLLSKKISIPKDDKSIDLSTGAPTGKSAASKLTNPEIQLLVGMGLEHSVKELLGPRSSDVGERNAMNQMLYKNGSASQAQLKDYSTGNTASKTLKKYWQGSHIKSSI